ncbi:MAG: hypothetical protein GY754_13235 [bacterium]|nr:hypothetical protein [bacterium]
MKKIISIGIFACFLGGCFGLPENLRNPDKKENSIVGVSVRTRSSRSIFNNPGHVALRVYFVKVDNKEQVFRGLQVKATNHISGRYAYLINAEPGTYVAVASSYANNGKQFVTFFDKKTIQATCFEVKPGEIKYMGDLEVISELSLGGLFDEAQKHYSKRLKPLLRQGRYLYRGKLSKMTNSKASGKNFLSKAKEIFKDSGWKSYF